MTLYRLPSEYPEKVWPVDADQESYGKPYINEPGTGIYHHRYDISHHFSELLRIYPNGLSDEEPKRFTLNRPPTIADIPTIELNKRQRYALRAIARGKRIRGKITADPIIAACYNPNIPDQPENLNIVTYSDWEARAFSAIPTLTDFGKALFDTLPPTKEGA